MKRFLILVTCFLGLLGRAETVRAVIWNVPGSFSTIQAALDAASSGDTVLVAPGTYAESLNFNWKAISLRSTAGPEQTIIRPTSGRGADIMGAGAELIGFTITNGHGDVGGGVQTQGSGSLIQGCIFDRNYQGTGYFGAAIGGNVSSPIIRQNIFRNHATDSQWNAGVVSFVNGSSPIIANNIFYGNSSVAISLAVSSSGNPQVSNNTIARNYKGILGGRGAYRNNIIYDNWGTGMLNTPGTFENNLVFGNGTDYASTNMTGIAGNISADPLFVNPASDYHLLWNSPAIDAGSALGAPAVDFAGTARPYDGNHDGTAQVDIGAYEYVPEPSVPALLGVGAVGLWVFARRRRQQATNTMPGEACRL